MMIFFIYCNDHIIFKNSVNVMNYHWKRHVPLCSDSDFGTMFLGMGHMTFWLLLTLLQFQVLCPAYTSVSPLKVKEFFLWLYWIFTGGQESLFLVSFLSENRAFFPPGETEKIWVDIHVSCRSCFSSLPGYALIPKFFPYFQYFSVSI